MQALPNDSIAFGLAEKLLLPYMVITTVGIQQAFPLSAEGETFRVGNGLQKEGSRFVQVTLLIGDQETYAQKVQVFDESEEIQFYLALLDGDEQDSEEFSATIKVKKQPARVKGLTVYTLARGHRLPFTLLIR